MDKECDCDIPPSEFPTENVMQLWEENPSYEVLKLLSYDTLAKLHFYLRERTREEHNLSVLYRVQNYVQDYGASSEEPSGEDLPFSPLSLMNKVLECTCYDQLICDEKLASSPPKKRTKIFHHEEIRLADIKHLCDFLQVLETRIEDLSQPFDVDQMRALLTSYEL
jgi:hypothetical protein